MPATPFQTEAWTEYGLGALVLFLRYFARWKSVGFKGYQGDDYFALAAMVFWTVSISQAPAPKFVHLANLTQSELVMLELIGMNEPFRLFPTLCVLCWFAQYSNPYKNKQVNPAPTLALPTRWVPTCQPQR